MCFIRLIDRFVWEWDCCVPVRQDKILKSDPAERGGRGYDGALRVIRRMKPEVDGLGECGLSQIEFITLKEATDALELHVPSILANIAVKY